MKNLNTSLNESFEKDYQLSDITLSKEELEDQIASEEEKLKNMKRALVEINKANTRGAGPVKLFSDPHETGNIRIGDRVIIKTRKGVSLVGTIKEFVYYPAKKYPMPVIVTDSNISKMTVFPNEYIDIKLYK